MRGEDSLLIAGDGEIFNATGVRQSVAYKIRQKHLNGTVQKFVEIGAGDLAGLDLLRDRTFRLRLTDGRAVPIVFITQRGDAMHFGIKAPTTSF